MDSTERRRWYTALALAVLLALVPAVAAAQSFQGASDVVVVGPDQTYDSVEGVAGSVIVRGTVTGDVSTAAGNVHVAESGTVGGDINAAAGTVRIDGDVDGSVSAAGSTIAVGETGQIGGDLDVGAAFLTVDGTVDGNVRAGAETIVLGPGADIGGEFRYDAETFSQDPDATVGGSVVEDETIGEQESVVPGWVGAIYGLLANLLLGVVLLAVFPAFSARVAGRVTESPVVSGGVGLGALVVVPLVLLLVAVTIVGIPLSLLGAVLFGLFVWVAVVYGQYAVGTWALGILGRENRWLALLVGLVGFAVLGAVPVLGAVVELAALLLGLGAVALALRDTRRGRRQEDTPGGRQTTLDEAGDTAAA